jgi:hypothetical protein
MTCAAWQRIPTPLLIKTIRNLTKTYILKRARTLAAQSKMQISAMGRATHFVTLRCCGGTREQELESLMVRPLQAQALRGKRDDTRLSF